MTNRDDPIKCLLVDDLDENLIALEALLRQEGLVCLKARSGDEALEALLVENVALALLDVQMPGMDGFELAEIMRGSERTRHVPIIFVTAGQTDARRRFQGYEAGAVDFIQKPIEADILRSKAHVFFDLYRQRQHITAQRDELETYAKALTVADRNKNEFLAILGHELRNPVMGLTAGFTLLERHADPDKADAIRAQMRKQVSHLSRLVEDLLDISRIDQGKILLRKERTRLQPIIEFAIASSRPQIDAGAHQLDVDLTDENVWLNADPTRVAQVISNLLNNAAKYTPRGGQIQLAARTDSGFAELDISDSGIGIPAGMQSKIFDLFAQVKRGETVAQDGLGIGLALVKQLVELHDGTVLLKRSVPNEGSTFQVRLPVAPRTG